MRQFSSLLALSVAVASGTRALDTSIFTFDRYSFQQDVKAPVVSDETAQRLLELRMNSPIASTLEGWDQNTVDLLNQFGGSQAPLFGTPVGMDEPGRSLLILENIDPKVGHSLQSEYQRHLLVKDYTSDSLYDGSILPLVESNSNDMTAIGKRHCLFHIDSYAKSDILQTSAACIPKSSALQAVLRVLDQGLLGEASSVESWLDEHTLANILKISFKALDQSTSPELTTDSLQSLFRDLYALSLKSGHVTTILLPDSKATRETKKTLASRDVAGVERMSSSSSSSLVTPEQQTFQLSSGPVCYASNSSCNEATNGCSGHGSCFKKSGSTDCYACKCQATTIRKEDGTIQTIRWGGSACQKRDISSPFFLVTGISILVVVATSAAIGMLFHVGQGELPGVISAGVGATRTQK